MENDSIKECPFCGKTDKTQEVMLCGSDVVFVECRRCGIRTTKEIWQKRPTEAPKES